MSFGEPHQEPDGTGLSEQEKAALAIEEREKARAMVLGQTDWGRYGNATKHHRYIQPVRTRRRCRCGCRGRVTHAGKANGVTLMSGCELDAYRWRQETQTVAACAGALHGAVCL